MTTKTLKRVRFNPAEFATEPEPKEDRTYKYITWRRTAVNIYSALFRERFHTAPLNPFIQQQLTFDKPGTKKNAKCLKYIKMFNDIADFLLDLREEHNAVNKMNELYKDYFTCILNHYWQYKRIPNINQLGPGPVNTQNFLQFATQEEHFGFGYWFEQKHIDGAKRWEDEDRPGNIDDPWIDLGRLRMGLKPVYRSYRKLSPNGEIMEHGIEKIYGPTGKLLETKTL